MDNRSTLDIAVIRQVVSKVLDHLEEETGRVVELEDDYHGDNDQFAESIAVGAYVFAVTGPSGRWGCWGGEK